MGIRKEPTSKEENRKGGKGRRREGRKEGGKGGGKEGRKEGSVSAALMAGYRKWKEGRKIGR